MTTDELRADAELVCRDWDGRPVGQTVTPYQVAAERLARAYLDPWRPIASAPRDGDLTADVWAYCSALKSGERHTNATRRGGEWYDCGGNKLNWGHLDADGEPQYRKVTHWMPLPPAPAA